MPQNRNSENFEPVGKAQDTHVLDDVDARVFQDGDSYEDGFIHVSDWSGLPVADGEHRLRDEAGWEYVGDVRAGKRDGLAVIRIPDGRRWAGSFEEGYFSDGVWRKCCGNKVCSYAYIYDGETNEGKPPQDVLAFEDAALVKEQDIRAVTVFTANINSVSDRLVVHVTNTAGMTIMDCSFTMDSATSELEGQMRLSSGYRPVAFFRDDGGRVSNSQLLSEQLRLTMKVLPMDSNEYYDAGGDLEALPRQDCRQRRRSRLMKGGACAMLLMLILLAIRGTGSDGDMFW